MAVDDAARGALKVVKWLAGQADDIVPTAEDIQRFGPNAARVRSLLEFLPTLSGDALRVTHGARYGMPGNIRGTAERNAILAAGDFASDVGRWDEWGKARYDAQNAVLDLAEYVRNATLQDTALDVAKNTAGIEVVGDLIDPQTYRILTNPLAAGRAVDVLRTRPRLKNTRFLDIALQAAERGAVTGPRDIVAVSRIAQKGEDVQEIALALMEDGMPAEQAMRTARMLAQ